MDFKTDGKNLKNFLKGEKSEKQSILHTLRKFCRAYENPKNQFARGAKILHTLRKPFCTPCENFTGHAKNSHTHLCFAKIPRKIAFLCENPLRKAVRNQRGCVNPFRNPKTHFTNLCEVQQPLRILTVI